jgi:hypothetical protein
MRMWHVISDKNGRVLKKEKTNHLLLRKLVYQKILLKRQETFCTARAVLTLNAASTITPVLALGLKLTRTLVRVLSAS